MKYMTFNSSCSYAGVANLLSLEGIDVSDRDIALGIGSPYIFASDGGAYIAGAMLQTAEWFDLFLNRIGFELKEDKFEREDVPERLRNGGPAMLGLRVGEFGKHAVIYTGVENYRLHFINNKRENSPEPEALDLAGGELIDSLDDMVVVAHIERITPRDVDNEPYVRASLNVLENLRNDLVEFCGLMKTPAELRTAMSPLFRALLVDALTMTEIIDEEAIHEKLKILQGQFMAAVKLNEPLRLDTILDMSLLNSTIDDYTDIIGKKLR